MRHSTDMLLVTIVESHYAWLCKMGYNRATPLEALALITSEIGEAVNCCRKGKLDAHLGEELADIVLRVFGLASQLDIDIGAELIAKIEKNYASGDNRGRII